MKGKKSKFVFPKTLVIVACIILITYFIHVSIIIAPNIIEILEAVNSGVRITNVSAGQLFFSLITVLQFAVTVIFTYFLYKSTELQRMQNFEIRNSEKATLLYYELKFILIYILGNYLNGQCEKFVFKHDKHKYGVENLKNDFNYNQADFAELPRRFAELVPHIKPIVSENQLLKLYGYLLDFNKNKLDNYKSDSILLDKNISMTDGDLLYTKYYEFMFSDNFEILNDEFKSFFKALKFLIL